jgi:hypothetical protein
MSQDGFIYGRSLTQPDKNSQINMGRKLLTRAGPNSINPTANSGEF